MKTKIITLIFACILMNACAYNPVIDTAGRSGTFNDDMKLPMISNTVKN